MKNPTKSKRGRMKHTLVHGLCSRHVQDTFQEHKANQRDKQARDLSLTHHRVVAFSSLYFVCFSCISGQGESRPRTATSLGFSKGGTPYTGPEVQSSYPLFFATLQPISQGHATIYTGVKTPSYFQFKWI